MRKGFRVRNALRLISFYVTILSGDSVRLWTTSRKSSSFPLSFFPTQPCGTNCTLHFHFCWDLNVKKVCCSSEDRGILSPSRFAPRCGTWSSWCLMPPFLSQLYSNAIKAMRSKVTVWQRREVF